MSKLYLGLMESRPNADQEWGDGDVLYVGPLGSITHRCRELRLFTEDGQELNTTFDESFLVVDGKLWTEYFVTPDPKPCFRVLPATQEVFTPRKQEVTSG